MRSEFGTALSSLRRGTGRSQRQAAEDLGVSQALLSHYENGAREPKLEFVVRACDYYGVSADYILGRVPRTTSDCSQTVPGNSEGAVRLANMARNIIAAFEKAGDPELVDSAIKYLAIPADNITGLLSDPDAPYDPVRDAQLKLAEADFIAKLQRALK